MTRWPRKLFGSALVMGGLGCLYVMDQATLVMNASQSLPDNAYLIFEYPAIVRRGSIVAFSMPPALSKRFDDALFVKVVGGVPGDVIALNDLGEPCVNGACYPLFQQNGRPIFPAIPEGRIPQGSYAVFGEAKNSLDSRYHLIGLLPETSVVGTGFAIPFPHWQQVATWF